MVSTDRFLAFAAMSLLIIAIPGPSVLFIIGRAAYLVFLGVQAFRHRKDMKLSELAPQPRAVRGDTHTVLDCAMIGLGVTAAATGRVD